MAAKLIHSLADENPDLQKQIGCMTGIFQLFDRHQFVTARRINQKRLPPGNSHFNYDSQERDLNSKHHRQAAADLSLNKGMSEKHLISTDSSRASFSSSCSSMSSLEFKAPAEVPFDHNIFLKTPLGDPVLNQTTTSSHLGCHSLDLRDVVKDSMYREARGLSAKSTPKDEAAIHAMMHRDSPRPLRLSKPVGGSDKVGIDVKQSLPVDMKESIRVLAKLREAPLYYGETRELPRISYEVKNGHWHSISKDAPRFSYDGREVSRLSFESRDTIKCLPKLKELPRLSLDSREDSWRSYSSDSKHSRLSRNFNSGTSNSDDKVSILKPSATQSRPPSVVAKLMGLEALPESYLANDTQSSLTETCSTQGNGQFSSSSKNGLTKPLQFYNSAKSSMKDPASSWQKNPNLVVKPGSSSRFPIEPAPWKQQDGNRSSRKLSSRAIKAPGRTLDSFPLVYSEIEKRLKDLEFKQSGRDLRAHKQILEAMQVKGLLVTKKEEKVSNVVGSQRDNEPKSRSLIQNSRSVRQQNPQGSNLLSSTIKGYDSTRPFESPIVIMKPAKLVEKTGISASSVIPIGGLSDSHKFQSGSATVDNKKGTNYARISKDQFPKSCRMDASTSSSDKKATSSKSIKSAQSQPRSNQFPKENSKRSFKHSGSVSPRLQQKKLELEKPSRPTTQPSDSNKPRRQSNKQATESRSPGRKLRHKVPSLQHSDDQLSEISNESRSLSCQEDEMSLQSDCTTVNSKMDVEVTGSLQSAEVNDSQSPPMKVIEQLVSGSMQKKSTLRLDEKESVAELATDAPEHPSPVSVLDGMIYKDDEPSPVKLIFDAPKAGDAQESKENEDVEDGFPFNGPGSGEINRKKLQSIDHLVQKLRRLNSSHDEARIDYIASLCENTNPDHRYISEILLASGLLLRDLSSVSLTSQLHSSGHPINPELFLVLEQTKGSSLLAKEENSPEKVAQLKQNIEKFHRRLIFDAVNEILSAILGSSPEPWLKKPNGLAKKILNAQKLLKKLCFEIEKMQPRKPECSLEGEGGGLKSMLWEDVMHGKGSWTDFHREVPGVVLDVERLIFKDLVNEIVIGEASGSRVKSCRRRKLFGK